MRALHCRSYVALWFLLQFGGSCAVVEESVDPRSWLDGEAQSRPQEPVCAYSFVQARLQETGARAIRCADFPYAVVLLRQGVTAPCSGAIISPTAVLSAAQCHTPQGMVLAGNSQYLNEGDFDPPTQFRLTKKCVMYDPRNRTLHDIMVCFVQQPFMESLYVSKVNVIDSPVPTNLSCIVTGFGLSDESHKQCLVGRSILQEIPNTWDCPGIHARGPSSICTRDTKTQAVCPGDMGAAAICRVGGNLHLVAVATGVIYSRMKPQSCTIGVEGNVYVQVHTYAKWLKKMVSDLNDPLEREPLPPWLPSRGPESRDHDEERSGAVRPREQSQDGLQDSQRIYVHGGRPVERGEFPFLALLEISDVEGVMACSGSIPSPTTVLSSAHCDVGTITAYAGLVNNTDMDLEDGKTQARYVESVTKPSYPKFYDIMICYVNESWIWSEFVAPIALYLNETSMQPSFVIDCQVLGFGQTMPDGPVGVAHVMKQLVGSSSQCAHLHPILWFFSFWMCSVDVNNKTMCQGDSGGPVMCSTATGFKQWAVNMGVAPAEKECLPQKTANVYVSTAYFRSWILDNIRDLASCAGSVRRGSVRIFTSKALPYRPLWLLPITAVTLFYVH